MGFKPEWIALASNVPILAYYVVYWQGPGKVLYWGAATVMMVGLLLMKG